MNQQSGRHHLLPATMTPQLLQEWIRKNQHEKFTDEGKRIFDEQELNDMARKSSAYWAEVMELEEQMANVKIAITNGIPDGESFELSLPSTMGIKFLKADAMRIDSLVDKGYETFQRDIYGIPDADNELIVYFGLDGVEIEERTRRMTPSEKNKYGSLFTTASRLNIENGQERTGTE